MPKYGCFLIFLQIYLAKFRKSIKTILASARCLCHRVTTAQDTGKLCITPSFNYVRAFEHRSLAMAMPTVVIVSQYQFVIRTREFDFEPPHVHVRVGNEDWARILLDNGEYPQ